jgi:hypothetical protein
MMLAEPRPRRMGRRGSQVGQWMASTTTLSDGVQLRTGDWTYRGVDDIRVA